MLTAKTVIDTGEMLPVGLCELLPFRLTDEMRRLGCRHIEEIRLRRDRNASLTSCGQSLPMRYIATGEVIDGLVDRLCSGSLYAYRETICSGYIARPDGVRVGICGTAAVENGQVIGVRAPGSLVFRISHRVPPGVGREVVDCLRSLGFCRGVLIYSPPGVGKTSVLRGVIRQLSGSGNAKRVAVVDTRGELGFGLDVPELTVDLLSLYPKDIGIKIATRSLGAEVIVCDEIGDRREADAIADAYNCGIPLVATAHAASLGELLRKPGIAHLSDCHSFGAYIGLRRVSGMFEYSYDVVRAERAREYL